jgi:hypothetical protein
MKRQNSVYLCGRIADVHELSVPVGGPAQTAVCATLITDHVAYGGHHQVLFVAEQAHEVLDCWALTGGHLEAAVEGWLRSLPGHAGQPPAAVVVADHVLFLNLTQAQRDVLARRRAVRRQAEGVSEQRSRGSGCRGAGEQRS